MQAFEQLVLKYSDVFSQCSVSRVGRLGKSQTQSLINLCVNGDLDQVLPPLQSGLRNPEIHMYLAEIYRLPDTKQKVMRL